MSPEQSVLCSVSSHFAACPPQLRSSEGGSVTSFTPAPTHAFALGDLRVLLLERFLQDAPFRLRHLHTHQMRQRRRDVGG